MATRPEDKKDLWHVREMGSVRRFGREERRLKGFAEWSETFVGVVG